jgi:DNA-binding transcriptional MerR regulator
MQKKIDQKLASQPVKPKPKAAQAEPAPVEAPPAEYTIDELAAFTRVPSRTVRFYQSKGALPKPEIRGRVAFYGPAHVERLRLIGQLQDRGLRIKAIRDLVQRFDNGELDLGEWFGLEAKLQASWADDHPRVCTEDEVYEMAGERRPGFLGDLLRSHVIVRQGDAYIVKSPALFRVAVKLEAAGVDLDTAIAASEIVRKNMAKAAGELSDFFFKQAGQGFGRQATPEDLGAAFEALRPLGLEAIQLIFGQEMERVLRKLVESGKAADISARKLKASRS